MDEIDEYFFRLKQTQKEQYFYSNLLKVEQS